MSFTGRECFHAFDRSLRSLRVRGEVLLSLAPASSPGRPQRQCHARAPCCVSYFRLRRGDRCRAPSKKCPGALEVHYLSRAGVITWETPTAVPCASALLRFLVSASARR